MKECLGKMQGARIRWLAHSERHIIAVDEEKFEQECLACEEFNRCAWQTTLALLREILSLVEAPEQRRQHL